MKKDRTRITFACCDTFLKPQSGNRQNKKTMNEHEQTISAMAGAATTDKETAIFTKDEKQKRIMEVTYIPGDFKGFTVSNVLTPSECADCITKSEKAGFVRGRFAGQRTRATYFDDELASKVYQRLEESGVLEKLEHQHDQRKRLFTYNFIGKTYDVPSGHYKPVGLNSFLRVSEYGCGGKFRKHTDTRYVRD